MKSEIQGPINCFSMRNKNHIHDYLLVNNIKSIYGLDVNHFLNTTNANQLLENNSIKFNTTSVLNDLLFASNLQVETFNLINYITIYISHNGE